MIKNNTSCIGCGESKPTMAIGADDVQSDKQLLLCHACIRPLFKVKITRESVARLMLVALRYDECYYPPGGD